MEIESQNFNLNNSATIYPTSEGWIKIKELLQSKYTFKQYTDFEDFLEKRTGKYGVGYTDTLWCIISDLGEIFYNGSNYLGNSDIKLVYDQVKKNDILLTCMGCDESFLGPEPKMCCNGYECGCMGMPIDPIVCDEKCYGKLMDKRKL